MRRSLWIAKFVAIQALVLFALAEIGLRLARPAVENLRVLLYLPSVSAEFERYDALPELLGTTIVGYHPYTVHAGYVANSRGFRTPEYAIAKPPGTRRFLILGDSFSFSSGGIPWSLGWQHGLQERLAAAGPEPVELLSLGVPGVGPLFEHRLWQVEGSRLDPDVVLLVFFVGNDFTDHFSADVQEGLGTRLARISFTVRLVRNLSRVHADPVATPLDTPVETMNGAAGAGMRVEGGYEIPEYVDVFRNREPLYSPERMVQVQAGRARLCDRGQAEGFDDLFDRFATILRGFRAEVEASGAEFRMVILPDRIQVNEDERREVLAHLRMRDRQFDWDKPQRRLRALLEREGVSYLDLLEPFRERAGNEQLFDPGNMHWNVRGNEFVAERIAAWLAPASGS
ncbi:SGNH/GDSL hydrolase family protein [bacterium]|nr:SGNH/GDSL hydrolase family protein [bacterium]